MVGIYTERTKGKLLMAAIELMSVKGYYGTSTRDITDGAGINPGGIYNHFESKHDLLMELIGLLHKNLDSYKPELAQWNVIVREGTVEDIVDHLLPIFPEEDRIPMIRLYRIYHMTAFSVKEVTHLYHEYSNTKQRAYVEDILNRAVKAQKIRPLDTKALAAAISDTMNYRAILACMFEGLDAFLEYTQKYGDEDVRALKSMLCEWLKTGTYPKIGITLGSEVV